MQGGDGKDCALHSTSLQVLRARHPAYDSDPVPSQLLHWSPLPANLDKLERKGEVRPDLIAIFKPIRSLAALKLGAGPVKTYAHRGMANYLHTGRPGTLEVRLEMGGGGHADLIPRLGQADATQQGAIFEEHPFSTLELRVGDMRQQLPGFGWQVMDETATLRPQDFLRWAGDLDGDGKLDLILDQSGGGGRIALYLSSLAKKGELVGLAGTFEYFDPSASGC
jgi:hypothetical protein